MEEHTVVEDNDEHEDDEDSERGMLGCLWLDFKQKLNKVMPSKHPLLRVCIGAKNPSSFISQNLSTLSL